MLAFSRRTDYALVALAELAAHEGARLSATHLAAATESPAALLRNVLKDLAQAGVLRGERGPFGGYALGRTPGEISVLDVVEAVEGPVTLARCCGEGETPEEHGCVHSPRCRIQRGIRLMHEGVLDVLRRTTVADLIEPGGGGAPGVSIRIRSGAGGDSVEGSGASARQR